MIEITAVSGYSEIGRNMTAVRYNDEIILLDMGIHLENYILLKGDDDLENFSFKELVKAKAVPDDSCIKDFRKNVKAIVPSHGHLDHIGAIPFMAHKYDCPIICTPYTASVLKAIIRDKEKNLPNEIISKPKYAVSDSITIEFIPITHSIPDAAVVIIHTPEGKVAYANDFKLDDTPVFGEKPDYEKLKSQKNIKALILDSLYAYKEGKTPSESKAREMLFDTLLNTECHGAIVVTTFSSHIARLKSIVEIGKELKRNVIFLGRSLARYVYAAEDIKMIEFSKKAKICNYKNQMRKMLKDISENKKKYLIVCTGHQGEPDAVLSKIAGGKLGFNLDNDDLVVFSCAVIPSKLNIENREKLEENLRNLNVMISKDVHVSGHAYREDHKEFIKMLKPEHIIPAHGPKEKTIFMKTLAEEIGYDDRNIHLLDNGDRVEINK